MTFGPVTQDMDLLLLYKYDDCRVGWFSRSCILACLNDYRDRDTAVGVCRRVYISLFDLFGLHTIWYWMTADEEFFMQVVFVGVAIYHILLYLAAFIYRVLTAEV